MQENGEFPDDVPIADAVEQQRTTGESSSDDDPAAWPYDTDVPLEATDFDWQEQRQMVVDDPDFYERE
ncbi:MAG: hypothetical protein VYA67_19130 [Actinomycetota bacterium]|uniref:Uncharacterized protein n=1 Tax=Mycobacterium lentiflavum TaxID=141349 RepID=A0ABY3UYV2_MYCLN|nr:hypothetical protein [Mycobacterium lentiflavum]MEE3066028.1 hypothetical protein [Actinomycetota bacterium]ULP44755.1 hypothetical protein MJO58_13085 [Mycobacterium lentiflavum]